VVGAVTKPDNTAERRASVPLVEIREGVLCWLVPGSTPPIYEPDEKLQSIWEAAQHERLSHQEAENA